VRIASEFEIAGPLSIRIEGFALVHFGGQTFGPELAAMAALNPFTAGASAMGVWSFE